MSASSNGNSWASSLGRSAAPLRDQVAAVIRKAILDFELEPGQRLTERELIERLGVSRTTVRDVLLQLTAEGLVTVTPQRGAAVAAPTPEEAKDLFEIRAFLEGLGARLFVERADAAMTVQLRQAFTSMERALVSSHDISRQLQAKDGFYATLLAGAANPYLQQLLGSLQARVRLLRASSLSEPGRPAEAVNEIRSVVEAIEAGDANGAAEACAYHVRQAGEVAMRRIATGEAKRASDKETRVLADAKALETTQSPSLS